MVSGLLHFWLAKLLVKALLSISTLDSGSKICSLVFLNIQRVIS